MEPITITALKQRVADLKRCLIEQQDTVLHIVDRARDTGGDIPYIIKEKLQNYFRGLK